MFKNIIAMLGLTLIQSLATEHISVEISGQDKSISHAGYFVITADNQVILGHTAASMQCCKNIKTEDHQPNLKPEFSPPSGKLEEKDRRNTNELTLVAGATRELSEEFGIMAANMITNGTSTHIARVFFNGYYLQVVKLQETAEGAVEKINASLHQLRMTQLNQKNDKISRKFDSVQAFPLEAFTDRDLVDFGHHPLNSDQNLTKYYDPVVKAAVAQYLESRKKPE
jgi:hypothetical protein